MTNQRSIEGRLIRLEHYLAPPECPTCLGTPSRVVMIDPDSDEVPSESMPANGCPACGMGVFREYRLVGDDVTVQAVP